MSHINEASIAVEVRAVVKVFGAALRTSGVTGAPGHNAARRVITDLK